MNDQKIFEMLTDVVSVKEFLESQYGFDVLYVDRRGTCHGIVYSMCNEKTQKFLNEYAEAHSLVTFSEYGNQFTIDFYDLSMAQANICKIAVAFSKTPHSDMQLIRVSGYGRNFVDQPEREFQSYLSKFLNSKGEIK